MPLEQLKAPPVIEVVCGFIFDALPLDPLLLGTYWQQRRSDFPKREVHPPIAEAEAVTLFRGMGPIRSWLISDDDVFLIQIQRDRFYLNWRKRSHDYPRFSDHPDKSPGILSRALQEFEKFQAFCQGELGSVPFPNQVDLAKIDHLIEGSHWCGLGDLAAMVPWLQPFAQFARSSEPALALRFSEQRNRGRLIVAADIGLLEQRTRVLKVESRMARVDATDCREAFTWANTELNEVFASLIPKEQRDRRFS